MIFTLCWKEFREHSTVWAAMAAVAALLLLGLHAVLGPQSVQLQSTVSDWHFMPLAWATFVLAVTYGLVCGAMMFAGEREGRTLPFLDSLPALRFEVWGTKVVAGLVLTLTQAAVIAGIVFWIGLQPGALTATWHWFWLLPLVCFLAYGWGLFGSSVAGTVMGGIAVGVFPTLLSCGVAGMALAVPEATPLIVGLPVVLIGAGVGLSGLVFTRPDWERWPFRQPEEPDDPEEAERPRPRRGAPRSAFPMRGLLWLVFRQGWAEMAAFAGLAAMAGLILPAVGWMFWPAGTLLIGVLCGTAVFRGDQADGAYRFLGELRAPAWQVWLVKVGCWLLAAAGVTLVFLIAALAHIISATMHLSPRNAGEAASWYVPGGRGMMLETGLLAYGSLWLTHGFAVGLLCGLVFRKSAVAVVLAFLATLLTSGPWLPSLLAGGVSWWQVAVGPGLLLAATFLTTRAWLGDRLASWRPAGLLAVAVVAAVAWLGGSLTWRFVEVPDVGEPFDVKAFQATVAPDDQATARSRLSRALHQMAEQESQLTKAETKMGGGAGGVAAPGGDPGEEPQPVRDEPAVDVAAHNVVTDGWEKATPGLERWLDDLFAAPKVMDPDRPWWVEELKDLASGPNLTVQDCRLVDITSNLDAVRQAQEAGKLFHLRAMQLLARGDEKQGVDHLLTALGLSRLLRHKAVPVSFHNGLALEKGLLATLDRWLDEGPCHRDVVGRVVAELGRHEANLPPLADAVRAEYLVAERSLWNPRVLPTFLEVPREGTGSSPVWVSGELAVTAIQMPWEKARQDRLLNVLFVGLLRAAEIPPEQWKWASTTGQIPGGQFIWLPATKGADAGLEPERLAQLLRPSLVELMVPQFRPTFQGYHDGIGRVRSARTHAQEVLAAMAR